MKNIYLNKTITDSLSLNILPYFKSNNVDDIDEKSLTSEKRFHANA